MADSFPPLPNIATQETVDKMLEMYKKRNTDVTRYGPYVTAPPPEKPPYPVYGGHYRSKEELDKIPEIYNNFHEEEWFKENPREKMVNGVKKTIYDVIHGQPDGYFTKANSLAIELNKDPDRWRDSINLLNKRIAELSLIYKLNGASLYDPDNYKPGLPYELKGSLLKSQQSSFSNVNNINHPVEYREMCELLHNFLSVPGNGDKIFKKAHLEKWFYEVPETRQAAKEYLAELEKYIKEVSDNQASIPSEVKQFLGRYIVKRKTILTDFTFYLYYSIMLYSDYVLTDILPFDFLVYDNDYRLNMSSSYRDFHIEDWFKRNPSTIEEVDFFMAKADEWIGILRDYKSNGNFADYSEGDIDREIIILDKRKKELEKIKEILILRPALYRPERWPEISKYHCRRNTLSEVQIYDPTQAKTTFSLRGKDLTPQSLIDAYKALVSDKINVIFKQSRDWIYNEAYRGEWDYRWYEWESNVPKDPAKQANIERIIKNLDYALDSDFGIMTAAPEVTVKHILSAVNPDEPKAADYSGNRIASMKNVMYALAKNIRLLSRVRKHKQKIYFRSSNGSNTYYGEYEVYRILKPEYWSVEDIYKEFYRVGEDITEENIVKLFNDIYTKLISIINGELDDPNPQGTDKDINNLETYFATGALSIQESDITRGKM